MTDIDDRKRAEEKLRQDEGELRRITDAIPQTVFVQGPDGIPIYANQAARVYTGLTIEDVTTSDFLARIVHPEDIERPEEPKRPSHAAFPSKSNNGAGGYRRFLIAYNPIRDEQGRLVHWYATGIDIEDRRQAEERMGQENFALRVEIDHSSMFEEIIRSSPALSKMLGLVAKVAPTDSTVLLSGETGTGKELIARAIHKRSNRAARAFIRLDSPEFSNVSCLVLDVSMPNMDRLELQRHLATTNPIPIIFITAHRDEKTRERALRAGAISFLNKPFSDEALIDSLHSALKK
jgi:formate hydrogenlyase transcriptional activator